MTIANLPVAPFDVTEPQAADGTSPRPTHAQRIGARLRRIRNQQRLSLADVQQRSDGVWKAVVVGAYERGDRAITMARLADLAAFYAVPLADLLPDTRDPAEIRKLSGNPRDAGTDRIVLDLTRLDERSPELAPVSRFADHVRHRRGDHNGRIMTLRGGDIDTVAMAAGRTTSEVVRDLAHAGALLALDPIGAPTRSTTGRVGTAGTLRSARTA